MFAIVAVPPAAIQSHPLPVRATVPSPKRSHGRSLPGGVTWDRTGAGRQESSRDAHTPAGGILQAFFANAAAVD